MILSRCFDFYMFMKFQMNGITSLHGMNKRREETNYCAFDDNRKLRATKVAISFMLKTFTFSVPKVMTVKRQVLCQV